MLSELPSVGTLRPSSSEMVNSPVFVSEPSPWSLGAFRNYLSLSTCILVCEVVRRPGRKVLSCLLFPSVSFLPVLPLSPASPSPGSRLLPNPSRVLIGSHQMISVTMPSVATIVIISATPWKWLGGGGHGTFQLTCKAFYTLPRLGALRFKPLWRSLCKKVEDLLWVISQSPPLLIPLIFHFSFPHFATLLPAAC